MLCQKPCSWSLHYALFHTKKYRNIYQKNKRIPTMGRMKGNVALGILEHKGAVWWQPSCFLMPTLTSKASRPKLTNPNDYGSQEGNIQESKEGQVYDKGVGNWNTCSICRGQLLEPNPPMCTCTSNVARLLDFFSREVKMLNIMQKIPISNNHFNILRKFWACTCNFWPPHISTKTEGIPIAIWGACLAIWFLILANTPYLFQMPRRW